MWLLARLGARLPELIVAAVVLALVGGLPALGWHIRDRSADAELAAVEARHRAELAGIRERAERARAQAEADARRIVEHQAKVGREVERALSERLAGADARAADLARRLQRALASAGPAGGGAVPAAAATACAAPGGAAEPGGAGEVERATAEFVSACERDASALLGWQEWWAGVAAGR